MVARLRLWESFKQQLMIIGMSLIITVGFPLITEIAGRDKREVPLIPELERMGYYVLRAAPFILLLLLLYNLWNMKRRQNKINHEIATDGVTYLILPRADGEPVRATEVTLWHRIALALPYYKHICFEMTGSEDGIVFSLRATDDATARNILSKVMAEWPGTQMRRAESDPLEVASDAYWLSIKAQNSQQPIVSSTPDPMGAMLSEIALLPKGVKAGGQVYVREDPFTRLYQSRKADSKTRKKPEPKVNPIILNNAETSQYGGLRPSAEERRELRWLDERAQEAFLETNLIIWAAADNDKTAKETAIRLAESLSAQYHPNNKLIVGWRCKKGNLMARTYPTFAGRPWVASELGTIAHLVGKDAYLSAPQLAVAPARPLPALPMCRLPLSADVAVYLNQKDESAEGLLGIILESDSEVPLLISDSEVPLLISDSEVPLLMSDSEVETKNYRHLTSSKKRIS